MGCWVDVFTRNCQVRNLLGGHGKARCTVIAAISYCLKKKKRDQPLTDLLFDFIANMTTLKSPAWVYF